MPPPPETSETNSFPLALLLLVPFLGSTENPIDDGLNVRINVREEAIWGSSLPVFFLREGSPVFFPKGPDCGTPRSFFAPKIDEAKEVSEGPNDIGPLCDVSNRNPTAPS